VGSSSSCSSSISRCIATAFLVGCSALVGTFLLLHHLGGIHLGDLPSRTLTDTIFDDEIETALALSALRRVIEAALKGAGVSLEELSGRIPFGFPLLL
jgi:hypothetical protein